MTDQYYIAQLNIAQMRAPLDDPVMSEFVENLSKINALGENSAGFVWLLKDDSGTNSATDIRPYEDERIIINMTVWESIEALYQYAYYSEHTDYFRRRAEWFTKMNTPVLVLWWVPAGHIPTVNEAKERLEYLTQHGPTPHAFTFKQQFSVEEMLVYAPHAEHSSAD